MIIEITYGEAVAFITAVWVIVRILAAVKRGRASLGEEAKMLLVYICLIVIARFVDFPLHRVNGRIGTLTFDSAKMCPPWVNPVPLVHLFEVYDGWKVNIIGNIAMFIPVGIVWPICFKKLDSVNKTVLAGLGLTVFIEITQLFFFERCSDIDDIILNTAGAGLGAMIFFGCRYLRFRKDRKRIAD